MEPEDADHPIEDEDRCREHGERVEVEQRLDPAELRILELGRFTNVGDRDSAPISGGEVADHEPISSGVDRDESVGIPLGADGHRTAGLTEPEEATRDIRRHAGLLDRDPEHGLEIELRPHLPPDRGDEPLAFERLGESVCRTRAIEGERSFGGEGLQQRELVGREHPRLLGRRDHEDRRHSLVRDERDEHGALGTDSLGQAPIYPRRAGHVVNDDRATLERSARDSRRLLFEIERDLLPPVRIASASEGR